VRNIDLRGEKIWVSGAGGAIGSAIAKELAHCGASILATDTDVRSLKATVAALRDASATTLSNVVDVTDSSNIDLIMASTEKKWGGLTGLVNAAGILRTGSMEEMTPEAFDDIMAVNVKGTYLCTKAVTPMLRAHGYGSIVNISSVSAFIGSTDGFAYTTTKGAVLSFTYGVAGALADSQIRVNAVCPGWVSGGFTQQAMENSDNPEELLERARRLHPLGRMATPEDVSNAVAWLMSPLASFITGTALFVDGGFMVKRGES
jgi:NAD(P)-dependent dehydrogenase (short-subunit alcohol dehydrogenase family)